MFEELYVVGDKLHVDRYVKFISSRNKRGLSEDSYTEKHHIIPRSMSGLDKESNLIELTAREHFIAHLILWKAIGGPMTYAFSGMCNWVSPNQNRYVKLTSRQFEKLKKDRSETVSKQMEGHDFNRGRVAMNNGEIEVRINFRKDFFNYFNQGFKMGGLPKSEAARRHMSESAKKKTLSKEHRRRISEGGRGRKVSTEQRENYGKAASIANRGRIGIHKEKENKRVKKGDLDKYLALGWELGVYRPERTWFTNGKDNTIDLVSKANYYYKNGWRKGRTFINTPQGASVEEQFA